MCASEDQRDRQSEARPHCCPCCDHAEPAAQSQDDGGVSRRTFLAGTALGGVALTGLSWSVLSAAEPELPMPPARRPLVVKPIFAYSTYKRAPQRSWRNWGGIQTEDDATQEVVRIKDEIDKLRAAADFPVNFLPVSSVRNASELAAVQDIAQADVVLVYAADGGNVLYALDKLGKDVILFVRHKSGPVYLWYEIVSPRYLRGHTDERTAAADFRDVVVDDQNEILWRLRSLCGLRNTVGSRILAIGGPDGWAQPKDVVPNLVREKWKLDIQTVNYDDLAKLIQAARADKAAVELARRRAETYLKLPGTTLETQRAFVDNACLLDQVFRRLMAEADCRAITINGCMGTIMPMAETSACLALSILNDDGYLAFCESDFVVIPSGMLLANISGRPMFLNDPTYPHDGVITLAHCTSPRMMDGKTREPARILTHFESDYGASPKVEMHRGQILTNVAPDFKSQRWVGFLGEIVDAPFLPICRSQIDIRFKCDTDLLAQRMPGFHWMAVYGDYLRETDYALKRIPIRFENLG